MPSIALLRDRLTFLAGFVLGGLWFLFCSALGVVWLLLRPGNRQTLYVYGRVFCRGLVRMMGWRIDVANRRRLDDCRPCVIVANHQSIADVVTFGSIFPQRTVSAGKREIGRIPIFGWFYRLSGNLIIDRDRARSARNSLEHAAEIVRDERVSVWFMPEGHRNTGPELLAFKSGAFRLAISAGVPILPVVAGRLTAVVDMRRWLARRGGRLPMRVLEPVSTKNLTVRDLPDLMARVHASMQATLVSLSAESGAPGPPAALRQ